MELLTNFWELLAESAPWLLLGYFVAGVINVYLPASWMQSQLGKSSFGHSVKAAFIGAPLPLCSCGVIPTALGLRKRGASKNATASFMVATPETGVDSISITYALLGPLMAIVRPIAAISSAIVAGELVRATDKGDEAKSETETHSCCSKTHNKNTEANSQQNRFRELLNFAYGKLLGDTANWLLLGLFFAALVKTFVPESFFTQWGDSIFTMLAMVVISIPMYICATASTPIAAGLIMMGVSPGSVLVFMLTGPATNLATIGVLGKELGGRAIAAYLTGVIGTALIMGVLLDLFIAESQIAVSVSEHLHHHEDNLFYAVTGGIFVGLLIRHYSGLFKRHKSNQQVTDLNVKSNG